MPLFDARSVTQRYGYSLDRIKQWRTDRKNAGLPWSYEDFLQEHGFCVHCMAAGRFITGICWRDARGAYQYMEIESPGVPMGIAELHEREGPQASDWEHTYLACDACAGTGRAMPQVSVDRIRPPASFDYDLDHEK
jgi:hypothetical protein